MTKLFALCALMTLSGCEMYQQQTDCSPELLPKACKMDLVINEKKNMAELWVQSDGVRGSGSWGGGCWVADRVESEEPGECGTITVMVLTQ